MVLQQPHSYPLACFFQAKQGWQSMPDVKEDSLHTLQRGAGGNGAGGAVLSEKPFDHSNHTFPTTPTAVIAFPWQAVAREVRSVLPLIQSSLCLLLGDHQNTEGSGRVGSRQGEMVGGKIKCQASATCI